MQSVRRRVSHAVTITGTTARGIGFLATIFGRQAVGKVLATREKVILRECVGTKDNEEMTS